MPHAGNNSLEQQDVVTPVEHQEPQVELLGPSDQLSAIPEGSETPDGQSDFSRNAQTVALTVSAMSEDSTADALFEAASALGEEMNSPEQSHWFEPEAMIPTVHAPSLSWGDVSAHTQHESDGLSDLLRPHGEIPLSWECLNHDDSLLDCDDVGLYVALAADHHFHKLFSHLEHAPAVGEVAELRCYEAHIRKAVIERSDDLLTQEEMQTHSDQCIEAMKRELKTWNDFKCFSRKPRAEASCIIDTRLVFKWKYVNGQGTIRA